MPHSSDYIHISDNMNEKKDVFTLSQVGALLTRLKLSTLHKPDNTELPCRARHTITLTWEAGLIPEHGGDCIELTTK